jgi:hypothetical protein
MSKNPGHRMWTNHKGGSDNADSPAIRRRFPPLIKNRRIKAEGVAKQTDHSPWRSGPLERGSLSAERLEQVMRRPLGLWRVRMPIYRLVLIPWGCRGQARPILTLDGLTGRIPDY